MSRARDFADLAGSADAGGITGRSLVINGACNVQQRGSQTGQGGGANAYTAVDRYQLVLSGAKTPRVTSSQQSTTAGEFANQLKLDCTTSQASVAAADLFAVRQRIEGQNLQHLQYGTASAKTLTASFTITSPKSGTHCVQLHHRDASYSYVREFTVDAANTAQRISVTFPGYTTTALDDDNASSLELSWPLLAGSDWQTTKDGWNSGNDFATSNQQNLLDNTANDFLITGIQLEVGEQATPFEHEPYSTTLQKAQRYYQFIDNFIWSGDITSGSNYYFYSLRPVEMRSEPSVTITNAAASGFNGGTIGAPGAGEENSKYAISILATSDSTQARGYFAGDAASDAEL